LDFNEEIVVEYLRHNNENCSAILAGLQKSSLLKIQYVFTRFRGLLIRFLFRPIIEGKLGRGAFQ